MSAAERMRRYRRKLRKQKRDAEKEIARARSQSLLGSCLDPRYTPEGRAKTARSLAWRLEWLNLRGQLPEVRNANVADELVRQLAEAMIMVEDVTPDDILLAINRRFPGTVPRAVSRVD
jgi:hypothetical protein